MWFAALGNYQHNEWFINMVYRLLDGQQEGMDVVQKGSQLAQIEWRFSKN